MSYQTTCFSQNAIFLPEISECHLTLFSIDETDILCSALDVRSRYVQLSYRNTPRTFPNLLQ